jgi:hypothetical protein
MTNINFDESSNGAVNDSNKVALNVRARGEGSHALWGETEHDKGGAGVVGISKNSQGVYGKSQTKDGVYGEAGWVGVVGLSTGANEPNQPQKSFSGVYGESTHEKGGSGVVGISRNWIGVYGESKGKGHGVMGETKSDEGGAGVVGSSKNWVGVHGISTGKGHGVIGETTGEHDKGGAGVIGKSKNWIGVLGQGPIAGRFEGDVEVTGDIRLLNADCAEDFDVAEPGDVEAGTVMVLSQTGSLQPSYREYDKKVAGVISGAGGYKPGIVLDTRHRKEQQESEDDARRRMPVALVGKVYCKVDATLSAIEVGDLLTTSSIEGHAMKASDPIKAFGTVIGKALKPLREGKGLIPILIALQ